MSTADAVILSQLLLVVVRIFFLLELRRIRLQLERIRG